MSPMERARSRKALVLGKDTRAFLSVVRSLGRQGIEVHAGWCDARAAAAQSRYIGRIHEIPPPSLREFAWRDHLLEILGREGFDLVIPCNDPSILPLQLHRKDFAPFLASIYLLDERAFEIVFDKLESYELARTLGITVPRRIRASRLEDLPSALASFSLPVLVKPRASFTPDRLASKHHVRWARSPEQLQSLVQALLPWGDVAVEESVSGRGVGVEVLAHEGRLLVAFQHVRVHEPPSGGGSSYRRSSELHPELLRATQQFLGALRYTGVAMMEFKVDPESGTWAFIEINARFWGSLPLALAAGVDFPYYLYQMWVEGKRDFPRGYRQGVYCRNLANDVRWMKQNWTSRMPADLGRLVTLREHSDTFVRDDPWPGLAELWNAVQHVGRVVDRKLTRLALAWPQVRRHRRKKLREALQAASRVLFVCKGNICRSPFAHRLAERAFPSHVRVGSAGYHPEPGRSCPAEAVHVAAEMGIDLRPHRSQVLSATMLRDADVIFVFDEDNYRTLRERYAWVMPRVHFLGVLRDHRTAIIRDPDGASPHDFRVAYQAIRHSVMLASRSTPRPTRGGRRAGHDTSS
jgi:protein-tyrosine-phosphatase/predicted ATP-grasp superfamily ATP-dependent carboligase